MPPRSSNRPAPQVTKPAQPAPGWVRPAILALAAILLLGLCATEFADSDAWWHLKTGEYIWQHRALPVPDPFAYTTYMGKTAYAGEENIRYFNLTHEWLSQAIGYAVYAAGGFPGVILFRALLLAGFCAVVGLIVYRRTEAFYRALIAALLAASVAIRFRADRPFVITSLLLAVTILILDRWDRRPSPRLLWVLPPMFLVWSNLHGGYFIGWVPLGVYCLESLLRKVPWAKSKPLWLASIAAILASGVNPNGFRAILVPLVYQGSAMQSALAEWQHTAFWEPDGYSVVLFLSAIVLIWRRRDVRLSDWMLWGLFAAASIWAVRNVILIGLMGSVAIGSYIPWKRAVSRTAEFVTAALLVAGVGLGIARGDVFQLRPALWKYPSGAADFLRDHQITGRIFNTYEYGGYLMWKLGPERQVFIDGRALNESLYPDYQQIANYADAPGGKTVEQLLAQYGFDVILMDGFEYTSGKPYLLAAALSDPSQKEWKLVYQDAQAVVFLRKLPPGVQPLNSLEALTSMESQCTIHLQHDPAHPGCAAGLADLFQKIGDPVRASKWAGVARGLR
jgi:hypothetical protein